ncbi:hypothetical protein PACTADRAFT_4940 [Pachysolen tannophilus NRRL Y-2460]|uniref:Protein SVP26 n=1 Tax=Pachysolen tannophilus NRRL Y-2460 TaxID=669874 RepID=A0A1E4TN23_PACTA|nr:hypothetical protein PACTADRAFT_4940 [Pachysolen tannophilus NRRL Y-2460]
MFFQLLSYFGIVAGFVSVTLAIASGLYYLSELVEEHTEFTKRILKRSILAIIIIYILLWLFDSFPFKLTIFSLFTYYIYYQNLKHFPYIKLSGSTFIGSCILVILNHYLWFKHFANPYLPSIEERLKADYKPPHVATFAEIASFFGICVWFVPFALFISLSASENYLPSNLADVNRINGIDDNNEKRKNKGVGLVKLVIGFCLQKYYEIGRTLGYELDPNHGRII